MKYYEKLNTLKGDFTARIENKEIENDKLFDELITFAISKTLTQVRHVIGSAGTGKSTLLINLIKHLKLNSQLVDIKIITPTNAARDVLTCGLIRSGLGNDVYTMVMTADSYLYNATYMGKDDDGKSIYDKTPKRILSPDVLIIDEFSLFPSVDWLLCCSLDCKIITVGDPKQLPAVADSIDCFCSVYNTSAYHYKLTTNYRQDNDELKNRIVELENTNRINLDNGSIDDICTILASKGNSLESMAECQGITLTNTSCKQYNKHVKKILLRNSKDFIQTLGMTEKATVNNVIVKNEVIVFRFNDKSRGIYNGNIFRVVNVKRVETKKHGYKWKADLENSNGRIIKNYDISTLLNPSLNADKKIENGYFITVHRSQGREWNNVFVIIDNYNKPYSFEQNYLYTAITRAKKEFLCVKGKMSKSDDDRDYIITADKTSKTPVYTDIILNLVTNENTSGSMTMKRKSHNGKTGSDNLKFISFSEISKFESFLNSNSNAEKYNDKTSKNVKWIANANYHFYDSDIGTDDKEYGLRLLTLDADNKHDANYITNLLDKYQIRHIRQKSISWSVECPKTHFFIIINFSALVSCDKLLKELYRLTFHNLSKLGDCAAFQFSQIMYVSQYKAEVFLYGKSFLAYTDLEFVNILDKVLSKECNFNKSFYLNLSEDLSELEYYNRKASDVNSIFKIKFKSGLGRNVRLLTGLSTIDSVVSDDNKKYYVSGTSFKQVLKLLSNKYVGYSDKALNTLDIEILKNSSVSRDKISDVNFPIYPNALSILEETITKFYGHSKQGYLKFAINQGLKPTWSDYKYIQNKGATKIMLDSEGNTNFEKLLSQLKDISSKYDIDIYNYNKRNGYLQLSTSPNENTKYNIYGYNNNSSLYFSSYNGNKYLIHGDNYIKIDREDKKYIPCSKLGYLLSDIVFNYTNQKVNIKNIASKPNFKKGKYIRINCKRTFSFLYDFIDRIDEFLDNESFPCFNFAESDRKNSDTFIFKKYIKEMLKTRGIEAETKNKWSNHPNFYLLENIHNKVGIGGTIIKSKTELIIKDYNSIKAFSDIKHELLFFVNEVKELDLILQVISLVVREVGNRILKDLHSDDPSMSNEKADTLMNALYNLIMIVKGKNGSLVSRITEVYNFTTELLRDIYRLRYIWDKERGTNFINTYYKGKNIDKAIV